MPANRSVRNGCVADGMCNGCSHGLCPSRRNGIPGDLFAPLGAERLSAGLSSLQTAKPP